MSFLQKTIYLLLGLIFTIDSFLPHLHHEQLGEKLNSEIHHEAHSLLDYIKLSFHTDLSIKYDNSNLNGTLKKHTVLHPENFTFGDTCLFFPSNFPNFSTLYENKAPLTYFLLYINKAKPLRAPPIFFS